ncbi:OmpH family outer membrane protein [Pseudodesulfovibrio sp.]|uniref:OmpH family outer membrane protein n=1 Tax=Pseudodesulfovibrio sp. TaxID=2035812 RepID=UPI00262C5F26|nr:OmpH family outer membrane protein [Pseudodesulfovibrio sp.]MDD3311507.1 OmpH family outer membrane protein [Pseudodesulfovibrio sp.]
MKSLKIVLAGCLFFLLCAPAAADQLSRVGFVNPQRIINESKIGRIAQEDLARLGKEKDRRVGELLSQIDGLKAELEKSTLSVSEQQFKEKELRLNARDYEELVQNSNLDIQGEERRLIQFIMRRADSILRRVAEERGFTMILTDPEIIGYVSPAMDITDRVIQELNAML